jgi:diguanylate cyclase (GGDEF)-like protein
MTGERKIDVAIWSAQGDPRTVEVAALLEAANLAVHDLDLATANPMVVVLLPGQGGPGFASTCLQIAEAYPHAPAIVLHTAESETAHPTVDHHVFELLPASHGLERLPKEVRSVLARWQRFEELKKQAITLQQLESTTDLVYFDFRPETGTFCPSPQLRQIIGHHEESDSISPSPLLDCVHTDDRALFVGTLFEAARSGTPFCFQIRMTDATGRLRHFRTRGRAFGAIKEGSSSRVFAVCEDTTDHMQRLAEAEARSRIDELTGLGNRRYFDDCLSSALARAKREGEKLALLYVDLDRFKLINDTLGHDAGDQLLRVISARLSDAVRAEDVVCHDLNDATQEARVSRLGGDEFTVLLSGIHGPADAELVANRMLAAMKEPVDIMGQTLRPSASVGIAMFPGDGESTDDLRKRADAALYAAKGSGGGFCFFKQSMEDGAVRRLSLEHELRAAIDREEIELHYQPRIDYRNDRIVGAEAVVRWSSPTLGRVNSDEVHRIAEDSGFITNLGRWTLMRACKEATHWMTASEEPIRLAVNISPLQFEQDDVFSAVVDALKYAGLPPELLDLEITESLLLRDEPSIGQSLEELRRIGVRIVLDEFGKGYSALAVLMSQPIDVLKLDQLLIETVAPDGEGSHLLANVIRMAHDLNLYPIAAGVSHADQAEFLTSNGCHEMQGFYFSAAIPARAFREKLEIA